MTDITVKEEPRKTGKPTKGLEFVAALLLIGMTLVVTLQIVCRYILLELPPWSEELSRYLMIWVTFLGGAIAVANDENIAIDIVVKILPARWQAWALFVADLAPATLLVLLIKCAIEIFSFPTVWYQCSPAMRLPIVYLYASLPLGCFLMLVFLILRSVTRMRHADESPADRSGSARMDT